MPARINNISYKSIAWILCCATIVATCLMTDTIPFMGRSGTFAASGRGALTSGALSIGTALTLIFWLLALWKEQVRLRVSKLHYALLVMAGAITLSTVFAYQKQVAVFGTAYREGGAIAWACLLLLCWLISQLADSIKKLKQLANLIIGMGVMVAILGIMESYGVRVFPWNMPAWHFEQGSSLFVNPDPTAAFLVIPTLLAFTSFLTSQNMRARSAFGIICAILGAELVITTNRGALIAVAVGLVLFTGASLITKIRLLPAERKQKIEVLTVLALSALLLIAIVLPSAAAISWKAKLGLGSAPVISGEKSKITQPAIDPLDTKLGGRVGIWRELLPAISHRPLLGWGADSVELAWQTGAGDYTARILGTSPSLDDSHSQYLNLVVYFGIPFVLIFIAAISTLIWKSIVVIRRSTIKPAQQLMIAGLLSAYIGLLTVFLSSIATIPHWVLFFAASGSLFALISTPAAAPALNKQNRVIGLSAGVGLLLVALGLFTYGSLQSISALKSNYRPYDSAEQVGTKTLDAIQYAPWRISPSRHLLSYVRTMNNDLSSMDLSQKEQEQLFDYLTSTCPEVVSYGSSVAQWVYQQFPEKHAVAEKMIDASLGRFPDHVPTLCINALLEQDKGQTQTALRYINRAVDRELRAPDHLKDEYPWKVKADILSEANGDEELIEFAKDYLERFPESTKAQSLIDLMNE